MGAGMDQVVRRRVLRILWTDHADCDRVHPRMEPMVEDRQGPGSVAGEELNQRVVDFGRSVPSRDLAQALQRKRLIAGPRVPGQVVEIRLCDLLREAWAPRTESELNHARHHRGAAKQARESGAKERDGTARLDALLDEARQPRGKLPA